MTSPPGDNDQQHRPDPGGDGLRGSDKQQGDLRDQKTGGQDLPEGLKVERKGPLGPQSGRRESNDA